MPYKRKHSRFWWIDFTDASGQRVRRSTGTTGRKEAEALEAKWKLKAFNEQQWEEEPARSFEEVLLIYLQASPVGGRQRERDAARHLKAFFAGRDMTKLRGRDVQDYVVHRRQCVTDSTINRELSVLSAAINYAKLEFEWDIPNPVSRRKPKQAECRVRWVTHAEATTLLRKANMEPNASHLADFICLALHTGCRKQELLGLEWSRVDLRENLIYLEGRNTKSGKRRSIPLNQIARSTLVRRLRFRAEYCPDSIWVFAHRDGTRIKDVRRAFTTACKRAGIKDFRIHDLRHTCAAWLVSAGAPLSEVRDLLGHSSVTMTEKYAHLAPENVRAAVRLLEHVSHFGHSAPHSQRIEEGGNAAK